MELLPTLYPLPKATPSSKAITKKPLSNCRFPNSTPSFQPKPPREVQRFWSAKLPLIFLRLLDNGVQVERGGLLSASSSYPVSLTLVTNSFNRLLRSILEGIWALRQCRNSFNPLKTKGQIVGELDIPGCRLPGIFRVRPRCSGEGRNLDALPRDLKPPDGWSRPARSRRI
jgi:hypothetical protein